MTAGQLMSKFFFRGNTFHGGGFTITGAEEVFAVNNTFVDADHAWDVDARHTDISGTQIFTTPGRKQGQRSGKFDRKYPPLPVLCSNCKSVFASRYYRLTGPLASIWNNEEPCPACGYAHAQLSEGIFDLTAAVAKILSAPNVTYEMLEALSKTFHQVAVEQGDADEMAAKIGAIVPALGPIVLKVARDPASSFMISLIALIVSFWAAVKAPAESQSAPASAPITFSASQQTSKESRVQNPVAQTLHLLMPVLGKTIIGPQAGSHGSQAAQPFQQKSISERELLQLPRKKKPHARVVRRQQQLKAHRIAFGGSRSSPPKTCR